MKKTFYIPAITSATAALASSYAYRCMAEGFTNEPRIILKAALMASFIASSAVLSAKASATWHGDMAKTMCYLGAATIAAVATLAVKLFVVL